jgi:hypothetical protein
MHASIRRYECAGAPITTDELVRLGREIAATLSHAPGFVSLLILSSASDAPLLQGQQQVQAAVSIFEDQPGLEQAEQSGNCTDRQIAAALTITEGTAGLHVHHILPKLGLRSRVQIGDWVQTHGLSDTPEV